MNQRSKQLAIEAGLYVDLKGEPWPKWMSAEGCEQAYAKFAELIVRECMKEAWDEIIDDENIAAETDPLIREYLLGNNQGIVDAVIRFRNHFGVEELPVCKHDWYSAKNPVVQNGSVCVICGAIDAREPEELKNERY